MLQQLADGPNPYSSRLAAAKAPVGSEALQREDGGAVMRLTQQIGDKVRTSSGCGSEWGRPQRASQGGQPGGSP